MTAEGTELELLDRLEERVDVAVGAVRDLRVENDVLKEEAGGLRRTVEELTRGAENGLAAKGELASLRKRCSELESKLDGVRGRLEKMVAKMKSLEG